jgi:hypothetical protein
MKLHLTSEQMTAITAAWLPGCPYMVAKNAHCVRRTSAKTVTRKRVSAGMKIDRRDGHVSVSMVETK